jgi:hypothetical protein
MKYYKLGLLTILLLALSVGSVTAQRPTRIKRPVKNPPQYPSIIDLEGKEKPAAPVEAPATQPAPTTPPAPQPDALTQALQSLTGEMRTLTQEMRALNLRQQVVTEMLRAARVEQRVEQYERELRPVNERLAALDGEEQTLYQLMTRESLLVQTANAGTFNRDETMNQLRLVHENRLRAVQAERERLKKLAADLNISLGVYKNLSDESERRMQQAEEELRQIENGKPEPKP